MKVLIACECSQTVCIEFRNLGVECYSCDIEKEYGGHPEWHIQCNVLNVLHGNCEVKTNDGEAHYIDKWDLVIAHPPCTYLSNAQLGMYNEQKYGKKYVSERMRKRQLAIDFFLEFTKLECPYVIENPVGWMNTHYKKPQMVIQPYMFGDSATKATCLWIQGLPNLQPTSYVNVEPSIKMPGGKSMGAYQYRLSCLPISERAKARSKTFPGIAKAIATQYTRFLKLFCGVE